MYSQAIRMLRIAALALTLLAMHNVARAGDLVAIVDLEFIRATDQPSAFMCYGDADEDSLTCYDADAQE